MLDHVSVGSHDLGRARRFWAACLAPLGAAEQYVVDVPHAGVVAIGYGTSKRAIVFWVQTPHDRQPATVGNGVHIAFTAPDRAAVDAFHAAALANGGTDEGPPGLRPQYHPDYYGAFVRDPDGNKVEACCHTFGEAA